MPVMKYEKSSWVWMICLGVASIIAAAILSPKQSLAMPFSSPTPETNSTINQPFVTFQSTGITHRLFHINGNVPVYWIIAILVLLLALTTFYLHSSRPRH